MQKHQTTHNGVDIYYYPQEDRGGFFLSLFVRAGSIYERGEESGITHFLEHIAIRNVHHRMEKGLYALLDRLGLEFNASTYSEMIWFYISGAKCHFPVAAKLLSCLLGEVSLPRSEIDTERRRIKAEIREGDERTSLSAFSAKMLYAGHPLGNSILGTVAAVNRITAGKLEAYRKSIFTAENMFFYAAGGIGEAEIAVLAKEIEAYHIPRGVRNTLALPLPRGFSDREAAVYVKPADFTMVRFHFDLDMRELSIPQTDLLYDMLLSGYNSRFFVEMSENRGLFYDINGGMERYGEMGGMHFSFELKHKDLYEAIALTVRLLRDVKNAPPEEGEMMKAAYVDNSFMLYDDMRDLSFTFAYDTRICRLPYRSLEERREAYRSVTPQQVHAAACQIFQPKNLVLTIKGDKKRICIEKIQEILTKL